MKRKTDGRRVLQKCRVGVCKKPVHCRRLCDTHYIRWVKYKNPHAVHQRGVKPKILTCQVQGCGKPHDARGLCNTHYAYWHRMKKRKGTP